MLFIESKTLRLKLDGPGRIRLLEGLGERNLVPLIRRARLDLYGNMLLGPDRIDDMDAEIAITAESETQEPISEVIYSVLVPFSLPFR